MPEIHDPVEIYTTDPPAEVPAEIQESEMPKTDAPAEEPKGRKKTPRPKAEKPAEPPPPEIKEHTLRLDQLVIDRGTQMRPGIDEPAVARYRHAYEQKEPIPNLRAVKQGGEFILWDGFNRLEALRRLGADKVKVDVQKGTLLDAIRYAVGANAAHGLIRDGETIKKSVFTAMDHGWGGSINELCRTCKIHHDAATRFLAKYYEEYPEKRPQPVVGPDGEEKAPKITVQRGGREVQMDVSKIGKSRKTSQAAKSSPSANGHAPKGREPGSDDMSKSERDRETFLKTFPFRDALAEGKKGKPGPRDVFDDDALLWSRLEHTIGEIDKAANQAEDGIGKLMGPFRAACLAFVEFGAGPASYQRCVSPGCNDGRTAEGKPCPDCRGAGFVKGGAKRRRR